MRQTLRLGRIAGIAVGVHWSVLVIMALLVEGLAVTVLPAAAPGQPWPVYLLAALAAAGFSWSPCSPTNWRTRWWPGGSASTSNGSPCGCSAAWPSSPPSHPPPAPTCWSPASAR